MKLLECHVDNFGKLSNFNYQFADGLTVIQEPNGFGKSTLSAFIKAMLYGLPRTAGRNIANNERKKYLPWQGGTYGGSLDFEFEGIHYRVWRTFGKTATKDRFSLHDLTNRKESSRFTEKLGEELFQLDAESFMRSIYMSQTQNQENAVTTSIQTKLSNLVDNTDDLNNYDSAMDCLRSARSEYRKFRGSGGRIDSIQAEVNRLEHHLDDAKITKNSLAEATSSVETFLTEKNNQEAALSVLHDKIISASTQQSNQTLREQFTALEKDLRTVDEEIQTLDKSYPKGYPSIDEVLQQNQLLANIQQAQRDLDFLVLKDEDVQREARDQEIFSDEAKTEDEIRRCQEIHRGLIEVAAQASMQMSKEELEQRERLKALFPEGVPSTEKLQKCKDDLHLLTTKKGALSAQQMTAADANRLSVLSNFFTGKSVDEEELTYCENVQGQIKDCQKDLTACVLSEAEESEWKRLNRVFSIEVPEDDVVHQKQDDCRRIDALNCKKEAKTTVLQPIQKQEVKKTDASRILIAVGALLLVAGILCFVLSKIAVGAIFSVIGFVVLLGAFWTHTKQMVNHSSEQIAVESSAISEAELQELYTLQKNVTEFLLKFYEDASNPSTKLVNLLIDKKEYLQLQERKNDLEHKRDSLCAKIDKLQNYVQGIFNRYCPGQPYHEQFITDLRNCWHEYERLQDQQKSVQRERENLTAEIKQLEENLQTVLAKYYLNDSNDNISVQLQKLEDDAKELSRLDSEWEKTHEILEKNEKQKQELTDKFEAILKKYHVFSEGQPHETSLEILRNNFDAYKSSVKNVANYRADKDKLEKQKIEAEKALEQFAHKYALQLPLNEKMLSQVSEDTANHRLKSERKEEIMLNIADFKIQHPEFKDGLPEEPHEQEELPDVDVLVRAEKISKERLRETEDLLRSAREKRKGILQTVEKIPEMEDQLARLMEQRSEAEQNCAILDSTLKLLEMAKENLSKRYVGDVEQSFVSYMHELLGSSFNNTLVDHDLSIHVDEKGEAREIDYFSAGTVDSIMLCMRLALVDTLFKQEKPFILLDDPFVNLDDEHTKRALEMLKKIAKDKQIVYMVCNSSRC